MISIPSRSVYGRQPIDISFLHVWFSLYIKINKKTYPCVRIKKKRMRKQVPDWKKIFVRHISDKGLVFRIEKIISELNNEKTINLIKNKYLRRHCTKHIYLFIFNWILLTMLLHLSWFFPLLYPSTQHPPLPQAIPPPLFMPMGHVYKIFGCRMSYIILYIPMTIL